MTKLRVKEEQKRFRKLLVMNTMQRISSRDFLFLFSSMMVFSNHESVDVVDLLQCFERNSLKCRPIAIAIKWHKVRLQLTYGTNHSSWSSLNTSPDLSLSILLSHLMFSPKAQDFPFKTATTPASKPQIQWNTQQGDLEKELLHKGGKMRTIIQAEISPG